MAGKIPRHFGIDPTGRHLIVANQGSNQIVHFSIDPKTGRLTPSGQVFNVSMPACVKYARSQSK
jgi:6-phosphogluconolactonase